jgi:hypothetical protein
VRGVTTATHTYSVNIEGKIFEWHRDTITAADIRKLAGFAADQQIVEVDLRDNTERTLAEGERVNLKPGHGFGKKVKFKRG